MGIRTKDIKKTATIAQFAQHIPLILPPGSATFFAAATARTNIVLGFAFTLAGRAHGAVGAVHLNLATATDFTNAFSVSVLLTGRDENHEAITETVTITGNGTAAQTVASNTLFSSLDSAVVTSVTGNVAGIGTALTFSLGSADTASCKVPNPYRGVPAASMQIIALGTVATIAATSVAPHNFLTVPNTTNQVRICAVGIFGQDPRSFLEA